MDTYIQVYFLNALNRVGISIDSENVSRIRMFFETLTFRSPPSTWDMSESHVNVKDLAKRFEALSPINSSTTPSQNVLKTTPRMVKSSCKITRMNVSVTTRPRLPPPMPLKRIRSSRRRRIFQSSVELNKPAGPFNRVPKSKSAIEGISSKTGAPESNQSMALGLKPQPPPKPGRVLVLPASLQAAPVQARTRSPVRPKMKPPSPHPPPQRKVEDEANGLRVEASPFKRTDRSRIIRKPSSRPPPPPKGNKSEVADQRIYQSLSSPDYSPPSSRLGREPCPQVPTPPLPSRLPRLPAIPPPLPPKMDSESDHEPEQFESVYEEDLYEEIEQEFSKSFNGAFMDRIQQPSTSFSPNLIRRPKNYYKANAPQEPYDYVEVVEPQGTQTLGRSTARRFVEQMKGQRAREDRARNNMFSSMLINGSNGFGTWTGGARRKNSRRPASALEFENLMKIKSELQSNLSRKVEKLKKKVAPSPSLHSGASDRSTSVYIPETSNELEIALYGDDWSSDDEEPELNKYDVNESHGNSLLTEIEAEYQDICTDLHKAIAKDIERMTEPEAFISQSSSSDNMSRLTRQSASLNDDHRMSSLPKELHRLRVDAEFDAQSCSSSSVVDDEDIIDEEAAKALEDSLHVLPDNVDSDSLSDFDRKSIYQSRLPVAQPLYQIYMLQEQQKIMGDGDSKIPKPADLTLHVPGDKDESDSLCDSNDNEDSKSLSIRRQSSSASTDSGRGADAVSRVTSNTSMRRERLTAGSVYGSQRSLWCELPEVRSAGLLDTLDNSSKKLQEAFFEVITSEASYLRSINVLISYFMAAPELQGPKKAMSVITSAERKHLFSNIVAIRDCAEKLLCDLENRLKESLVLTDVSDILCEHFEKHFDAYVKYCSNQVYQDRVLKRLKLNNSQFLITVQKIEANRECQGLDMRSFLMLPMQRVTRYPLLVFAILERVADGSPQQKLATKALNLANRLVRDCNEGARRMERTEQLLEIERRLVYKSPDLKRIPLVTTGRYVVKSGSVTQLLERKPKAKLGGVLQSKQKARALYIFLFSDLLMIAKKKLNGTFVCKDYAARRFVEIEPVEPHSNKIPIGVVANLPSKAHLFLCILMHNARGKQVELLLNTDSESDRERWLSAMRPPTCSNPDEKIYAEWDCPQAVACHNYEAVQEDELSLEEGDLINILRKMPDGWFYGERPRDHKGGWFPSSYVQQVMNDHVRANNYRQRLRVIQAANGYQHRQLDRAVEKRGSLVPTSIPPLSRLRRLSNPKAFFTSMD
ncbi:unnamed protein product [Bursaphelenchus xylophilus]|uniref:(pine wood nematode) hypothetical protein n=1 Tax=Bursaphelenchus xylophilus TaxID=6326 RepID=A0A1I7SVY6_BURXY|nr:unnamed protein product [Bursaphelenchus xylophilus]CAG9098511.1 unnamed protein product [Bursaphelenchus xylophilus]